MSELIKVKKGRNMKKGRASQRETEHCRGGVRNPPVEGGETLQWLRVLAAHNCL